MTVPGGVRSRVLLPVLCLLALVSCAPRDGTAPPVPTTSPTPSAAPSVTPSPTPGAAATRLRFAAVGDIGDGSAAEAGVAAAIAAAHGEERLDALLLLGDLIYPKGDPAKYQGRFAEPYQPVLAAGIPLISVLGNHDIMTDGAAIQRLFGMPAPYYTTVRGPVEFFVLDNSRGRVDPAQRAWLDEALGRSASPWKVVVMHIPLFSSGELHGSSARLQASLQDLLERHGVQLAIAGHDHNYERTVVMGGVTYIVSGGGCCPRKAGRGPFTAAVAEGLHFVVFDAEGDVMRVRALGLGGHVLDEAEISRRAPVPVP